MNTVPAKQFYFMSIMQTILFIWKDGLHYVWKHFLRGQQCTCAFVSFSIQHGEQTASLESIGSHGGLNANNLPGGWFWGRGEGKPERSKSPFKQDVPICQPLSYRGWVPLRISSWGKKRRSFISTFPNSVDQRLFLVLSCWRNWDLKFKKGGRPADYEKQ